MTLPRFQARIFDALGPSLAHASLADISEHLQSVGVTIRTVDRITDYPEHVLGLRLLANLAARLYPRIKIVAPREISDDLEGVILSINPDCEFEAVTDGSTGIVSWGAPATESGAISVSARGWTVLVGATNAQDLYSSNPLATFAAASVAASELFRSVFSRFLNLRGPNAAYTLGLLGTSVGTPALPTAIDLGRVHLVGAGAIGQAMIGVLAEIPVSGELVVIDPETVTLSNLQRYILSGDTDVGASKVALAARTLAHTKLRCIGVQRQWGSEIGNFQSIETVCTALDTARARIDVQASLPHAIYNAWTQPSDIGWSRHERFGEDPCLACLYWPRGQRPSQHTQIATALRQHELRVLGYLAQRVPVDMPLVEAQIPRIPSIPVPPNVKSWCEHSLLDDIARALDVEPIDLAPWKGRLLADLYREGICGGGIISTQMGLVPTDVAVPMAHQSVLAGVMLATTLVSSRSEELRSRRGASVEYRLDMNAAPPRMVQTPRKKTPSCICSDSDFINQFEAKWGTHAGD